MTSIWDYLFMQLFIAERDITTAVAGSLKTAKSLFHSRVRVFSTDLGPCCRCIVWWKAGFFLCPRNSLNYGQVHSKSSLRRKQTQHSWTQEYSRPWNCISEFGLKLQYFIRFRTKNPDEVIKLPYTTALRYMVLILSCKVVFGLK